MEFRKRFKQSGPLPLIPRIEDKSIKVKISRENTTLECFPANKTVSTCGSDDKKYGKLVGP